MNNRGIKVTVGIGILSVWITIAGCDVNGISERINRGGPYEGAVRVAGMNGGRTVYVYWEADRGADGYILMRTEVAERGIDFGNRERTREIAVKGTYYLDNDIVVEKSYAYRLDKERGRRVYGGKEITIYERTRAEPTPGKIMAQNLNGGKSAFLSWEMDGGADEYRVMRAVNDGNAVVFSERVDGKDGFYYQGESRAVDSDLEDDKGYFYRLDKLRDGVWQIGKEVTIFSRARPFPYGEAPRAKSFRPDGYIELSWHYDEGADSYILMRSYDNPLAGQMDMFVEIYEGREQEFTDVTVNSFQNGRYAYRLYKRRNGEIYRWDNLKGYGVAVRTQEDRNEPNNTEAEATLLEDFRIGNLYYFAYSEANRVISDIDWYKVSIAAGKTAKVAVVYSNPANSSFFQLYDPYKEPVAIVHNTEFSIKNDSAAQKYVYFALMPDPAQFAGGGITGGQVVSYTINWVSVVNN